MNLVLSYQTQDLPAPFAFAATFTIDLSKDLVVLDFNLEYLGRDELTEEEIIAEGFSTNDDFKWKGSIGKNWNKPLESLLNGGMSDHPKGDFYLHLSSKQSEGYPDLSDDVIIQALLQAVFEAAGKEAPLQIHFHQSRERNFIVRWEFAKRKVVIGEKDISWSQGYELLNLIYASEIDESTATKKTFNQSISLDGTHWINISGNKVWELLNHYH